MDTQAVIAIIALIFLSAVMGLLSIKVDWAIAIYRKMYGLLGINVSFTGRGRVLIRFIFGFVAAFLLFGAIFIMLE